MFGFCRSRSSHQFSARGDSEFSAKSFLVRSHQHRSKKRGELLVFNDRFEIKALPLFLVGKGVIAFVVKLDTDTVCLFTFDDIFYKINGFLGNVSCTDE